MKNKCVVSCGINEPPSTCRDTSKICFKSFLDYYSKILCFVIQPPIERFAYFPLFRVGDFAYSSCFGKFMHRPLFSHFFWWFWCWIINRQVSQERCYLHDISTCLSRHYYSFQKGNNCISVFFLKQ